MNGPSSNISAAQKCPSPDVLDRWVAEELEIDEAVPVRRHVDGCAECRSMVQAEISFRRAMKADARKGGLSDDAKRRLVALMMAEAAVERMGVATRQPDADQYSSAPHRQRQRWTSRAAYTFAAAAVVIAVMQPNSALRKVADSAKGSLGSVASAYAASLHSGAQTGAPTQAVAKAPTSNVRRVLVCTDSPTRDVSALVASLPEGLASLVGNQTLAGRGARRSITLAANPVLLERLDKELASYQSTPDGPVQQEDDHVRYYAAPGQAIVAALKPVVEVPLESQTATAAVAEVQVVLPAGE